MPVWQMILIADAVVIAVALVIIAASYATSRRKSERLRQHYGPEYERLVSETGGRKSPEKELLSRERERDKLDIRPLTQSARNDFNIRWQLVQTAFVDDPAAA